MRGREGVRGRRIRGRVEGAEEERQGESGRGERDRQREKASEREED